MYDSLYYYSARYLNVQSALNESIEYVTVDYIPTLYFVSGHGEKNTYAGPLDITAINEIPRDAALLIINNPESDFSSAEADMIIKYMNNGGRVLIFTSKNNNDMPNIGRILAEYGLLPNTEVADLGEKVNTTVNTSSGVFSALASTEKLTLNMINATPIAKVIGDGSISYTTLFSYDVEGENETVTYDVGVVAMKNGQPRLTWVSAAETFNKSSADLTDEEKNEYVVSVNCLSAMVASMNRSFEPTMADTQPKEYDLSTPLTVDAADVTAIGAVVICVFPLVLIGAGLISVYARKKRSKII